MNSKHFLVMFVTSATAWASGLGAAQSPVILGSAESFAILAKSGVSTTGTTSVVGNIGVSPIDSTGITGFSQTLHSSGTYATSSQVTGVLYASDFEPPTPAYMTTAIGDMEIAYADASGRIAGDAITELGAGDISGRTLVPNLYKWSSGLLINADITLSGPPNAVWILQIAGDLTVADGVKVILSGGAQAANIFWQVASEARLGTTSHFEGIILGNTAIHLNTGATMNGGLYAQTAVTLDAASVTLIERSDSIVIDWFGIYYIGYANTDLGTGWIYHWQLGWIYKAAFEGNGFWLWHVNSETWLWTSEAVYPFFFNGSSREWIYGNP